MMRVLIADDHPVVRMALAMILTRAGHEIVGECENGTEAVQKAHDLTPEVLILDLDMPLMDGLSVLDRLRLSGSEVSVLVISGLAGTVYASRCLRAGAVGYLAKSDSPQQINAAFEAIGSGRIYFPAKVLNSVRSYDLLNTESELLDSLSKRELHVLRGLAQGSSNKKIAEGILISSKTISTYRYRILQKLNMSSLLELVEFAKRNHVI